MKRVPVFSTKLFPMMLFLAALLLVGTAWAEEPRPATVEAEPTQPTEETLPFLDLGALGALEAGFEQPIEMALGLAQCPVSSCPGANCGPGGPCSVRRTSACACSNPPPGLTCPAGQTIHVRQCPCVCVGVACSVTCTQSVQKTIFCA